MRLRVLGEVDVMADGEPVHVGSRSQRVVLAVLAARPGVTVPADLLVDALWGDDPPASARSSLRTYVSRLRRLLGDDLVIGPTGYALDLPEDQIDAGRFEQLADQATVAHDGPAADPPAAVALWDQALALWRGAPFGDVADVEPLRGPAARLEERRLAALEARAAGLLAAGRPAEAVAAAEALVAEQPLREGAWAVLVEALTADSRAPEALRAYQRAATVLADAGLEPTDRVQRAEAAALARAEPEVRPRRLAVATSSLVGRDADVAAVVDLLAWGRIVTLVGPGGVGKTRLALAVAAEVADRHEWGARLVELAGVSDARAVPDVVADGLGLAVGAGGPEEALARAGRLDMLGVLDNCEHVVEAAARTVETVCTGGTGARLLATSREPLGVDGEQLWPVSPLPTGVPPPAGHLPPTGEPGAGSSRSAASRSPAHELFLRRAREVRPGFDPDEAEQAAIDQITRRLDGLPLAIEMAATRVATLPATELAARIDDQLGMLVSRRRTAEPRHRTLTAVVAWSERLLEGDERDLFTDMAVFEGAVRPDDVAAVTGRDQPLDRLCRLAERSLLVADTAGAHARFGMLRTVRDRAAGLLAGTGRADELARRHAAHMAETLTQADHALRGMAEAEAHARIEELLDEARAAVAWAAEHDRALGRRLCGALFLFGQSRRRDEVLGWATGLTTDVVPALAGPDDVLVLVAAAQWAVNRNDLAGALDLAQQAVAVGSDRLAALSGGADERAMAGALALAYEIVGDIHTFAGRLDQAAVAGRAGLTVAERAGDAHAIVANLIGVAMVAAYGGHHDESDEVLATAPDEAALSPSDRAWLRYTRGETVLDRGPPQALAALDEAIELADSVGNRYVGGVARVSATSLRARAGDPEAALAAFAEVISHWRGQGGGPFQATTLRNLVVLLQRLGAAPEAAQLLGSVEGSSASPTFGDEARRLAEARAWVVGRLGEAEARRQLAAGAARTLDEAAVVALDWIASH